MKTNPIVAR